MSPMISSTSSTPSTPSTSSSTTLMLVWRSLLYCGLVSAVINPRVAMEWAQGAVHALLGPVADHLQVVAAVVEQAANR